MIVQPRLVRLVLAADGLEQHALAVDRDLELMLVLEPADRFEVGAKQRDFEFVFAVERKMCSHADAADGTERQAFEMLRLRLIAARRVRFRRRRRRRIAERERADAIRRREIALEQCRRDDEQVADVVEAERGVVGRQQRCDVDVEIEQIANRVRVLGAIQAPQRRRGRDSRRPSRRARSRATRRTTRRSRRRAAASSCGGIVRVLSLRTTRSRISACVADVREVEPRERQLAGELGVVMAARRSSGLDHGRGVAGRSCGPARSRRAGRARRACGRQFA